MVKLLSALSLIAGTLVLAVVVTMPGAMPAGPPAVPAAALGTHFPGLPVFAAGILVGLGMAWVWSLPWGDLPMMIAGWFRRMTRRAKLIGLGVLFACVILYF